MTLALAILSAIVALLVPGALWFGRRQGSRQMFDTMVAMQAAASPQASTFRPSRTRPSPPGAPKKRVSEICPVCWGTGCCGTDTSLPW